MDCIFCKIANKEVDTELVYENDHLVIFKDMSPQAPVHLLAIPRDHIGSANEINSGNAHLIGEIYKAIGELAKTEGFAEDGYRIVNNCGEDGGQTVGHLHFHILAGRNLQWPPG